MPRNKMVWRIVLLSGLSARCAKLIHSSLREQSNGNGHLSSLKMELIFPPKEISSVLPEFAILFPAYNFSEGTLADVHSFFWCTLFTLFNWARCLSLLHRTIGTLFAFFYRSLCISLSHSFWRRSSGMKSAECLTVAALTLCTLSNYKVRQWRRKPRRVSAWMGTNKAAVQKAVELKLSEQTFDSCPSQLYLMNIID